MNASTVNFEINGRAVSGGENETIIEIAKREGVAIPHLCYKPGLEEVGNCRACVVEIGGERVLAPSCCRHPSKGMKVTTDSERAVKSQKLVLELLLADMPERAYTRHNEVEILMPVITEAIERCAVCLVACSPASLGSRNCRQEIALAWRYELSLIHI